MFVYITSNATVWMRIFECRAPFFPFSSSNHTTVENFLMAFLSVFKPLLSLCDFVLLSSLFSCFLGYALISSHRLAVRWPICNIIFESLVTLTMRHAYTIRSDHIQFRSRPSTSIAHLNCMLAGWLAWSLNANFFSCSSKHIQMTLISHRSNWWKFRSLNLHGFQNQIANEIGEKSGKVVQSIGGDVKFFGMGFCRVAKKLRTEKIVLNSLEFRGVERAG